METVLEANIRGLIREEVHKVLFSSPGFDIKVEGPIEKIEGIEIVGPKSPWGKAAQRERGRRFRQLLHGALEIAEGWEGCDG